MRPLHPSEPGLATLASVARFYARALAPTAVLVLWMFTIYAALAYVVPHVLCAETVSALPVRDRRGREKKKKGGTQPPPPPLPSPSQFPCFSFTQSSGFKACVKASRSGYAALSRSSKIFMTCVWATMEAWLVVYVGLMGRAMFRRGLTKGHLLIVGLAGAALAAAVAAAPALGRGLDDTSYVIAPIPVGLVATLVVGHALTRTTGDPLDLARWFVMMAAAAAAVLVYMIYMPEIITRRSLGKPWHLLAARMVAHPFIWSAITELFAHTGRYVGRVPRLMHATMFVWPAMYGAIFGRFLLLQLDTAGSVSALNVQLALIGLVGRLGGRGVSYPLKFMYGGRAAEAVEASRDARQLRVTRWVVNMMAEHAGIVCSAAIYTFGAVSREFSFFLWMERRGGSRSPACALSPASPPFHAISSSTAADGLAAYPARSVWTTALWQALTVLAADGAGLAIDWAFHGADPRPEWPASIGPYLGTMAILVTIGGARIALELIMLFCPTTAPGDGGGGVLLSYCNKPSLFDKM